jgi:hypothetical protein
MPDERRRGTCDECGAIDVPMATSTACYACYQRARRANQASADPHNPSLRKEHVKLVKLYSRLVDILAALRVDDIAKHAIMEQVRPYFRTVTHLVNVGSDDETPDDAESSALIARIRAVPMVRQGAPDVDWDSDWTPAWRADLLACYRRWRAEMDSDDMATFFAAPSIDEFFAEVRAIGIQHGHPKSIALQQEIEADIVNRAKEDKGAKDDSDTTAPPKRKKKKTPTDADAQS